MINRVDQEMRNQGALVTNLQMTSLQEDRLRSVLDVLVTNLVMTSHDAHVMTNPDTLVIINLAGLIVICPGALVTSLPLMKRRDVPQNHALVMSLLIGSTMKFPSSTPRQLQRLPPATPVGLQRSRARTNPVILEMKSQSAQEMTSLDVQ